MVGGNDGGLRSRRSLLAAALGGVAAAAAGVVSRTAPVAANGEPMVVGGRYTDASAPTYLRNERNDRTVLAAETAVANGVAIQGDARAGVGVLGWCAEGDGVRGEAQDGFAVSGWSQDGFGVGAGTADGIAMFSVADGGIGVLAWTSEMSFGSISAGGYALASAGGRLRLNDIGGVASIRPGRRSVRVAANVPINADTFVLLSPRSNLGGRSVWYTTEPASGSFTIHLDPSSDRRVDVAWLMVEASRPEASTRVAPDLGLPRHRAQVDHARVMRRRLVQRRARPIVQGGVR